MFAVGVRKPFGSRQPDLLHRQEPLARQARPAWLALEGDDVLEVLPGQSDGLRASSGTERTREQASQTMGRADGRCRGEERDNGGGEDEADNEGDGEEDGNLVCRDQAAPPDQSGLRASLLLVIEPLEPCLLDHAASGRAQRLGDESDGGPTHHEVRRVIAVVQRMGDEAWRVRRWWPHHRGQGVVLALTMQGRARPGCPSVS
jgi:hypothetical protein